MYDIYTWMSVLFPPTTFTNNIHSSVVFLKSSLQNRRWKPGPLIVIPGRWFVIKWNATCLGQTVFFTFPETNSEFAPEKLMFGTRSGFLLWDVIFYRCKLLVSGRVADQFGFFLVGLAGNYDWLEGKVLLWICLRIPDPFIKWGAIGVTRFYPHLSLAAIRSQQNPRCCPRWRHALRVVSNPTRRFGSIWLL